MGKHGKRASDTALISYNAPEGEKDRLRQIAKAIFPGEKNSFSLLMRQMHREFIEKSKITDADLHTSARIAKAHHPKPTP
jgi:hypothetical protein